MTHTSDVHALTDLFQDLLFDVAYPNGAPRDDTDIPVASPEDWAHEARAVAHAVAPFLQVIDGQLACRSSTGALTDNETLALHLRRDHGITGGWVSDPVPPGPNWTTLLNQIHATACKGEPCPWGTA